MQKFGAAGGLVLISAQNCRAAETEQTGRLRTLVEAARGGDAESFGELYRLYAPMVHGILLARVPTKDVDDLMQDVFVAVHTKIHTLREPAAFGGWLATLTRNRAYDFHRHARETEELPDTLVARQSTNHDEAAEILAIVRTLPDAYRETLILRLAEGLTGPEIAELTGLTPASVRVNLSRGMKLLRVKLGAEPKQ